MPRAFSLGGKVDLDILREASRGRLRLKLSAAAAARMRSARQALVRRCAPR